MTDETLIADMVRAGVDPELIGRVANALLNVRDNVRDIAVKEHERKRKRKWRETAAAVANSGGAQANDGARADITSVPQNVPDNGLKRCDLSSTSSSVKVVIEEEKKGRSENARARATRLERTTVLSLSDRTAAIELGADPARVDGMWAEFIDYWIGVPGQRGTKLDWSATWRNRVRMIATKGTPNGTRPNTVSNAFDDLIARSESAGGEDCGEPADDLRVVSPQGR